MPRRPRPAHRPPPRSSDAPIAGPSKPRLESVPVLKKAKPAKVEIIPGPIHEPDEQSSESEDSDDDTHGDGGLNEAESEVDLDAPRVALWEEDDWQVNDSEESDEEEDAVPEIDQDEDLEVSAKHLKSLQNDLSSIPFGTLRKAQLAQPTRISKHNPVDHAEDSDSSSISDSDVSEENTRDHKPEKEWSIKPRIDLAKRTNKHAPTEVSSKRPVPRRRTVVEVKAPQPRDPRFLDIAGQFSEEKFKQGFSFLSSIHLSELKTLRENLKRARKMVLSSPREKREEWEAEVWRLEQALKRAESTVNKEKRERVERDALEGVKKVEKGKRAQGKGQWFMKDSAKRELLVKARFDALAASGGKGAVKKAIERKQKKVAQKEKKSRPFAKEGRSLKRSVDDQDSGWAGKRRKVSS